VQGRAGGDEDMFVDPLLQRLRAGGADPADLERRLTLALQSFDEASIFTIHGFCQRALAELALSVGLAPASTLVEDDAPLARQVAQDFWRRRVADPPSDTPAAQALGAALLRRHDSPASWALRLRERQRQPLAELRWPEGAGRAGGDADDARDGAWAALDAAHRRVVCIWRSEREALVARLDDAAPRLHRSRYSASARAEAIAAADRVAELPWSALAASGSPKGFERLGSGMLRASKGQVPLPAHPFDDAVQALLDRAVDAGREVEHRRLARLREFLEQAPAALAALKRSERVAGFDDLLLDLHRRLVGEQAVPGLATRLRQRFPAALIDEFQDTDPLQYAIFDAIYGADAGTPVAMVGDPKQAIYSFRSADLPTYLQAREAARAHSTLRDNQRSTGALIRALNGLFTCHDRPFMLEGLRYVPVRPGARPRPSLSRTDGGPESPALQLWTLPRIGDDAWLPLAAARRACAHACAGEIARRIDDGRSGRLMLGGRPFAGGDVAVLVRTHAQGREMRRALSALGVASIELSPASVFASADAEAAELVLAAVLEPTRASSLRAALATDWLGADATSIAALADEPDASATLLLRFAAHHERWRRRGVAPMLRRLLRDEGVTARLLARPDGERRLTDVLHLVECLQQASAEQRSPQALLRWLQVQRSTPPVDEARQLRLDDRVSVPGIRSCV
jgi:exodeoxyribonuclease V beta subunit